MDAARRRRRRALPSVHAMDWQTFVEAANAISWITYMATADRAGRPHVAVVATGFTDGSLWFVTNQGTKCLSNIKVNPSVGFHWPVGGSDDVPGELVAYGRAKLYTSQEDRSRLWHSGIMTYDLAGFFRDEFNEEVVFVEVEIDDARLLGPDFVPRRWHRS